MSPTRTWRCIESPSSARAPPPAARRRSSLQGMVASSLAEEPRAEGCPPACARREGARRGCGGGRRLRRLCRSIDGKETLTVRSPQDRRGQPRGLLARRRAQLRDCSIPSRPAGTCCSRQRSRASTYHPHAAWAAALCALSRRGSRRRHPPLPRHPARSPGSRCVRPATRHAIAPRLSPFALSLLPAHTLRWATRAAALRTR